ncbi:hypothetical protein [Novosphingobium sp. KA1]|uniref:hypothetical protein n=1 Tax=Novosphingobium sp. (strain KA1) TaxID=164608 RepID=UPI001A8CD9F8|nr:hypothetical protein [Novosphingobium sp. KA1]QSR17453.1 hypothetical protein CA833_09700 [Novosphingobium sp. KA1]
MPDRSADQTTTMGGLPKLSYAWAFQAYESFVETLSPEVCQHLGEHREDSYTVVFGRTQVGKTTLILNLLGLMPQAVRSVSWVLRGGRKAGNSSTAIPTEYRRSRDDCWRIIGGGQDGEYPDDDEACIALSKMRIDMEKGKASSDLHLCVVEIPDCRFRGARGLLPGTRILDLPGADAQDLVERRFVSRVAESLVPNADLILLVGRADDLTFLNAEHLALPGLSDWQITPHRFRVVTTFSFTPPSIRDFSRRTGCWGDEEAYRQRLIGEIEGLVALNPETRDPQLYFPLEFGETWDEARDLHDDRLTSMIDRLMQRLHHDIAAANSPLSRLEGAIAIHGSVMRIHEAKLEAVKAKMQGLEEALARSHDAIRQLEGKKKDYQTRMARLSQSIPSDKDMSQKARHLAKGLRGAAAELQARALDHLDGPEVTRDMILELIDAAPRDLKASLLSISGHAEYDESGKSNGDTDKSDEEKRGTKAFWKSVSKLLADSVIEGLEGLDHAPFAVLRERLQGYWLNAYWRKGGGSQLALDRKAFEHAHDRLALKAAEVLRAAVMRHALATRRKVQEEEDRFGALLEGTADLMAEQQSICEHIAQERKSLSVQLADMKLSIHQEKERSQKFGQLLSEAYNREIEEVHRDVLEAPDAVTAFEQLALGSTLRAARERVGARIVGKHLHA